MLQNKRFDPQDIAEQRALPALFILDNDGKVVSHNAAARQLLAPDSGCLQALRSIGERLAVKGKINFRKRTAPTEAFLAAVVHGRQNMYGLQAFWIHDHCDQKSFLMGVLLEKITPTRSDLHEAGSRFHLTSREMQVIRAIELGLTDKEIASALKLSPATVRSYLKAIRGKLGVSTRTGILHALRASTDHEEVFFTPKFGPPS